MNPANARHLMFSAVAQAVRPRKALTVSQWADAHRVLSDKASSRPGPWHTSATPFLREILDALSERSPVKRLVLMTSSQVGKTEVALNWLGYIMHHSPGPTLVVLPTLDVRRRWVLQRLSPLLEESPALRELMDLQAQRKAANAEDIKDFPGGMLVIGGANSPASLASMPIRYVICDELDRFPWEAGREGDPLGLIERRQANFPRRKTLLVSTPTIRDASRVEEEYNKSDRRRYHVPCPHCGEYQPLEFKRLQWDKGARQVWYVCAAEGCGAVIEEHHKPAMLAAGRWVAENPGADTRGYHLSSLYSSIGLGYSWKEIAKTWLEAQEDPAKLKQVINTILGESYFDRARDIKPNALAARAEPYALRTIPRGCLLLTAGVDTQDDRLEVHIVGWGKRETAWTIDYIVLPGDPAGDELWQALDTLLRTPLVNQAGQKLHIEATLVDSGGHHAHDVYRFARESGARRVMAGKGASTHGRPVLAGRPSSVDYTHRGKTVKNGAKLWMVGADTAKHLLFNRLGHDADKPEEKRLVRFSSELPREYFEGLTAEVFDPEKNRFVKRRGRRNEPLDTWVYALAAAHHPELRIHRKTALEWDRLAARIDPEWKEEADQSAEAAPPPPKPTPPPQPPPPKPAKPGNRPGGIASDDWSRRW